MNIAVVDDIKSDRDLIIEYIYEFFTSNPKASNLTPNIFTYHSGEEFLAEFSKHKFDIIILDIYMDTTNGMSVAKKICSIDNDCKIIFCTTSKDFILDGYQVHAAGYLVKPISENISLLYHAIEYIISCQNLDTAEIVVEMKNGRQKIRLKDIIYMDCQKKTVIIHLKRFNLPIENIYNDIQVILLDDTRFIECYRNIIVNMDYITSVLENDFLLPCNETIPISRRKKRQVLNTYMEYILSRGGYIYNE